MHIGEYTVKLGYRTQRKRSRKSLGYNVDHFSWCLPIDHMKSYMLNDSSYGRFTVVKKIKLKTKRLLH